MEYVVFIFDIAIAILLVHCCKENLGRWFYYCILLMAFGIQNIFQEQTNSLYISTLNAYLQVNEADVLYYGVVLFGVFITMACREERTVKSLFKCAGTPLVIFYLLSSKYQIVWILSFILIMILSIALVVQSAIIIRKRSKKKKNYVKNTLRRFISITHNRMVGVLLTAMVLCLTISIIDDKWFSNVAADVEQSQRCRSLSEGLIEKINEYDSMTVNEKLKVLKEVVAVEIEYLGIEADYVLIAESLAEGLNGWFDKSKMIIAINENLMETENFETSLHTCLHEVYHLYQYELVTCTDWSEVNSDLKLIRDIVQWQQEYEDYKSVGEFGYEEYSKQALEVYAREFSDETTKIYMDLLSGMES